MLRMKFEDDMLQDKPAVSTNSLKQLEKIIRPLGRLAVLLSGGVDSGLLAAAAAQYLGAGNVLALTLCSPLTPEDDPDAARSVAARLGLRHLLLPFDALSLPEVAENRPERCYACKREVIRLAQAAAGTEGFPILAEGSNADDLGDDRPGWRAVREAAVLSPLAEVGLTKPQVRSLARELGLGVWERPSSPCLATRFPTGHHLSEAEIALIGGAEAALRGLGLKVLRLRWQGGGQVRLEVGPGELAAARSLLPALTSRLLALGLRLSLPPLPYGQKKPPPQRLRQGRLAYTPE